MYSWVRRSGNLGEVFRTFSSIVSQSELSIWPRSVSHLNFAMSTILAVVLLRSAVYRLDISFSDEEPVMISTSGSVFGLGNPFVNCA